MKVLVVDVAAQNGGAATILNHFVNEFKSDKENNYVVVLSTIHFENNENVIYIYCPWVKKSYVHRLWFDAVYCKKLVRIYKPDKILSLQNCAVSVPIIEQEVYFQNALPISEKRYSLSESKSIWLYQNVLGLYWKMTQKKASRIYVQGEWIKNALVGKWKIDVDKLVVIKPKLDEKYLKPNTRKDKGLVLFYPANTAIYKNHEVLLQAFYMVCNEIGNITLLLTGDGKGLSETSKTIVKSCEKIKFLGRLTQDEMVNIYCASALIFPSLIETVGLPLMEAKALKAYILANDAEYAHEAIGAYDRVIYFNAQDINSIKNAIIQFAHWRSENENSYS